MEGLGNRIRHLRKAQHLTIIDIVKKTRIDQATLSRIENGKMKGTIDSHMKIAEALGIRLSDLYEDVLTEIDGAKDKKTKEKIETFSHSSGAVAELLTTSTLQKRMMPILLKIKCRRRTEEEEYPALSERFVYVLKGPIELRVGPDVRILKTGESFYFNAARSHYFKNAGKTEASCLSVLTPVSL